MAEAQCEYSGLSVQSCQSSDLCDCFDNGGNNPERGNLHPEAFAVGGVQGPLLPCPECRQGKCGNCDGDTWDAVKDERVPCPCWMAGHDHG